jgi:hypothetical protein
MLCTVLLTRDNGWLLPRYRHAFARPPTGRLQITDEAVHDLNRQSRVAHLLEPSTGKDVPGVPPLYDVVLLRWACDQVTLTGFERIPDDLGLKVTDYAQTWQVMLDTAQVNTNT